MKKGVYVLITVFILLAGVIYWFISNEKKNGTIESEEPGTPKPQPAPPVVAVSDNNKTYFVDQGEGLIAVNQRMNALYESSDFQQLKGTEIYKLFEGLIYPSGFKSAMAGNFGSVAKIPVQLPFSNNGFQLSFEGVKDATGFEKLVRASNFQTALNTWKGATEIEGISFWPKNLGELINANEFGNTTKADKDKSERYDAFTTDFKTFAGNMVRLCNDLQNSLKRKAIQDLIAAGWKFSGQA